MADAYQYDIELFEKKQPALNKLKLLPYVEKCLRKVLFFLNWTL